MSQAVSAAVGKHQYNPSGSRQLDKVKPPVPWLLLPQQSGMLVALLLI